MKKGRTGSKKHFLKQTLNAFSKANTKCMAICREGSLKMKLQNSWNIHQEADGGYNPLDTVMLTLRSKEMLS